jgi:hypothetical protein
MTSKRGLDSADGTVINIDEIEVSCPCQPHPFQLLTMLPPSPEEAQLYQGTRHPSHTYK